MSWVYVIVSPRHGPLAEIERANPSETSRRRYTNFRRILNTLFSVPFQSHEEHASHLSRLQRFCAHET